MDPVVFSGGLEDNHRFVFSDFLLDRGMTWQAEAVQKATWAETFGLDEYGVYASCIHIGKMRLVPFKNSPFWLATERKPELPWNSLWKILPQISSKPNLDDFLPTFEEWRHACIESDLGILQQAEVWEKTKRFKSPMGTFWLRALIGAIPPFDTEVFEDGVIGYVVGYIRVKIPVI